MKVAYSIVEKVETGDRDINPAECNQWAEACGLSLREFWGRYVTRMERRVWKDKWRL